MKRVIPILLITATAYAFVPNVNTVGLVGHWKLWDGLMTTGLVFDYSLNGNTGTLVDTDTPITLVPTYPGFSFDGSNHAIDTGSHFRSTFQDSFSFSIWFKVTDGRAAAEQYLFGVDGGADTLYLVIDVNGRFTFKYDSDSNTSSYRSLAAAYTLADGQADWHHIVATADSAIAATRGTKLYFDGVFVIPTAGSTGNTASVVFADYSTTNVLYIGAENAAGVNGPFGGLIDDVMLFNKALSAIEVRNIYEVTRWRYSK